LAMMLMFTISWKLSLAVLCIIPFLICGTAVYARARPFPVLNLVLNLVTQFSAG
jgi:hypothetical protein